MKIGVNRWLNCLGALSAGLLVVVFSLLLVWHNPLVFWNDDYELSVLPVFADMARSWSEGNSPILSPYSWVCGNLAGEFQYGTFSVFVNTAVILIWKFPLTFPQQAAALSIAHLFVLAIGAFLLARDRRLSIPLSIFVALIAALNGWIICWGATDWFGALGAFTWLPWAWWGAERALDQQRTKWRFLWPAPFVYLVVTGGFPYTVLMLLLLIAWLAVKSFAGTRNILSILPMLFGVALGFGLSAPAWLAILDLVQGSARESQSSAAHWQWLVPPSALPGLILPCWTVNWADFSSRYLPHTATGLACGLVAPAAIIAGLLWRGRVLVKQIKWELVLLLLVLLLCMIPTAGLFRWSFRWLPFFHLVLAICAAEALQTWAGSSTPATAAFGLVVLTAIAMFILRATGTYAFPLTWILLGLAGIWWLLTFWLRDSKFQGWPPPMVTFLAFLATYFCIPTNCGVPTYNFSQQLLKPAPLDPRRLYLSVYPWAELTYCVANKPEPVGQTLRPGSTSMWGGLHFINGYSPIRAAGVAREFGTTIHGEINPEVGEYLLNQQAGEGGELASLGVDGIVVAREIDLVPQPSSEWQLVVSTDEGRVFHRRGAPFARVRSVNSIDSRPNEQFVLAAISQIDDSRNRVEVDVDVPNGDRPALLTFSRPYFRGYQARLGDQKLAVASNRGLFPVVEIPAGTHGRLALFYRPNWLMWGGAATIACALIIALSLVAAISSEIRRTARNLINRWSLRQGLVHVLGVGLVIGLVSVASNFASAQEGGDVRPAMLASGGDSVAANLHYPAKAKAKKDEAAIPFYCEVGADGKPAFISLFGPEDKTEFRVALLKALDNGRFQPAMSGGKAVPVLLGGTAFLMFRGNEPIMAISLSTADKEKTAALGNYIQPQLLSTNLEFRRKLWHAQHAPDIHPLMGVSPVHAGAVVLAQIDAQGNIVSTRIVAESRPGAGYGALLVKGFQGAKFIPAFSDGKPVTGQFDMIANYDKMQSPNWSPDDTHIKRDSTNW